jgi:hypothetical protein
MWLTNSLAIGIIAEVMVLYFTFSYRGTMLANRTKHKIIAIKTITPWDLNSTTAKAKT